MALQKFTTHWTRFFWEVCFTCFYLPRYEDKSWLCHTETVCEVCVCMVCMCYDSVIQTHTPQHQCFTVTVFCFFVRLLKSILPHCFFFKCNLAHNCLLSSLLCLWFLPSVMTCKTSAPRITIYSLSARSRAGSLKECTEKAGSLYLPHTTCVCQCFPVPVDCICWPACLAWLIFFSSCSVCTVLVAGSVFSQHTLADLTHTHT